MKNGKKNRMCRVCMGLVGGGGGGHFPGPGKKNVCPVKSQKSA